MARILEFSDGAERGDMSWWTSYSGDTGTGAVTSSVIHGTYCYYFMSFGFSNAPSGTKTISAPISDMYLRCWVKPIDDFRIAFNNSSTTLLTLRTNTGSQKIDITGGVTASTPNNSFMLNDWQCLEVRYKVSDTVGVLTIKVDNAEIFTYSGDTKPGSETAVDKFIFYGDNVKSFYIDDLALDDAEWCGLGYYLPLNVAGNGSTNQWTSSSGNPNYQNVDEIPPSDTDFNSSMVSGQVDEYTLTTIDLTNLVVQRVIPFFRLSDTAGGSVNAGIRTNSTNYTTTIVCPTSFTTLYSTEYLVNPNTGLEWTQSDINNLQLHISVP